MDQHLLFPRSSTHGVAMEMAAPEVLLRHNMSQQAAFKIMKT
jgi:hypothetical protein